MRCSASLIRLFIISSSEIPASQSRSPRVIATQPFFWDLTNLISTPLGGSIRSAASFIIFNDFFHNFILITPLFIIIYLILYQYKQLCSRCQEKNDPVGRFRCNSLFYNDLKSIINIYKLPIPRE